MKLVEGYCKDCDDYKTIEIVGRCGCVGNRESDCPICTEDYCYDCGSPNARSFTEAPLIPQETRDFIREGKNDV